MSSFILFIRLSIFCRHNLFFNAAKSPLQFHGHKSPLNCWGGLKSGRTENNGIWGNTDEKCSEPAKFAWHLQQLLAKLANSEWGIYCLMYSVFSVLNSPRAGCSAILSVYRYLFLLFFMLNDFLSGVRRPERKQQPVRDLYAKCSRLPTQLAHIFFCGSSWSG